MNALIRPPHPAARAGLVVALLVGMGGCESATVDDLPPAFRFDYIGQVDEQDPDATFWEGHVIVYGDPMEEGVETRDGRYWLAYFEDDVYRQTFDGTVRLFEELFTRTGTDVTLDLGYEAQGQRVHWLHTGTISESGDTVTGRYEFCLGADYGRMGSPCTDQNRIEGDFLLVLDD